MDLAKSVQENFSKVIQSLGKKKSSENGESTREARETTETESGSNTKGRRILRLDLAKIAKIKSETKKFRAKFNSSKVPKVETVQDNKGEDSSSSDDDRRVPLEREDLVFDEEDSDDESDSAHFNNRFQTAQPPVTRTEADVWGESNGPQTRKVIQASNDLFTSLESLHRGSPQQADNVSEIETHLCMEIEDTRFGFSVIGGRDEGLCIQIDEIKSGSPADKADLEVGDEILEVNGKSMEEATHGEVISHIHQCIRSRTICLRVKRRSGNRLAADFNSQNSVQDAFVIAVEQQARERLERLSALKRIKPVDMTKLSHQLNQIPLSEHQKELNGFIEKSPIYVTSFSTSEQGSEKIVSAVRVPDDDTEPELELTQDIDAVDADAEVITESDAHVRTPSPFVNGRTEVLIGQENVGPVRTAAVVEHNRLGVEDPDVQLRPRRRSGSSIVVVGDEPIKYPPRDEEPEDVRMMMTMLDSGPHRELPVDVPDSFIAMSKTPPRYPPPKSQGGGSMNGSAKPVPPPRDHLRIEKDGRLTSRLPAPQVPARSISSAPTVNNNVPREPPTKQELEAIRKFEEELRQRKEEEDRVAKQAEFLKGSLRGSKKLHALESHPPAVGVVNDGYSDEEYSESSKAGEVIHKIIGYGELVAALQRLQHQLKRANAPGLAGVEGHLAAVQGVLLSPQFGRALSVCNKVQEVSLLSEDQCLPGPQHWPVQQLLRDCIQILEPCTLPEATELSHLLSSYEMEGLLQAHDTIASGAVVALDGVGPSQRPARSPGPEAVVETPYAGIKVVKIEKTNEPLGATVRNDGDAVVIGRVVKGGAAEKSGLLHEGDEVLQVNGVDMRGKSIHDVCDILAGMIGTLTFIIIPGHTPRPTQSPNQNTLMHMKAHFDYDPEDDAYIPCKELGISFQKGDVLHVISQEDGNWWQAYREGEEDQILAGLIPSASFQHQRESLKQQIAGDRFNKDKNKKASTLLCAKKHKKKKKKKTPYSAYSDGSYPLYSSTVDADYDADEILTYEEVALYYPRSNRKRPIVLIGPPNIGRHELRQRLMEDSERFAAAIPHTSRPRKESEIDGQDYHFISRAQFEADILARRFVEHGEYEKAYYGTSLEAIRAVVNSGKICVLNLHPQSLKILRTSDLKPYVVFVAPPSLERLRQKKIKNGESYKEEELKDIIEKAREMEDKYGHFLDMIIINNDTERAFQQLQNEISSLEREPQWVPAVWVKAV